MACARCGTTFTTNRSAQRYCGPKCRDLAKAERYRIRRGSVDPTYMKEWHLRNPGKSAEYSQNKYRRFVSILTEAKSVPCMDCNTIYPRECMDFDHVRGIKMFNISTGMQNHTWQEIKDEISKCDVVCANCHRIRTAARQRQ